MGTKVKVAFKLNRNQARKLKPLITKFDGITRGAILAQIVCTGPESAVVRAAFLSEEELLQFQEINGIVPGTTWDGANIADVERIDLHD